MVINIVDATSIERSLYLTTQLLELDTKVIIALNMADMLEKKQIRIDEQKLSELLHTSFVRFWVILCDIGDAIVLKRLKSLKKKNDTWGM